MQHDLNYSSTLLMAPWRLISTPRILRSFRWAKYLIPLLYILTNLYVARNGYWDGSTEYERLQCTQNQSLWKGPLASCGLNAELCTPFKYGMEPGLQYKFRCPANCIQEGRTFLPWQVGNTTAYRVPFAIGGPVYRGDSFICVAAVHAGIVSSKTGGCGTLEWVGSHPKFDSKLSSTRSFYSLDFDTEFPINFKFVKKGHCNPDLRIVHIAIAAICILFVSLRYMFSHTAYWFFSIMTYGFWTIILGSNPPWTNGQGTLPEVFSLGMGRFMPFMFGAFYIYVYAAKPLCSRCFNEYAIIPDAESGYQEEDNNDSNELENSGTDDSSVSDETEMGEENRPQRKFFLYPKKVCLYCFGFGMGVLENYVFGYLPLDRLTVTDLNDQSGAWLTFILLFSMIFLIIISQTYYFYKMNKFKQYFPLYCMQALALVGLSFLPMETLRVHHYILALLLLPGTCIRITPSYFYQGILLGLYTSGVARWDFAPIVETSVSLSRGSALARAVDPTFTKIENGTIYWQNSPNDVFDGYTLTINDIQRYIGLSSQFNMTEWIQSYDPAGMIRKYYVRVAAAALGKHNINYSGRFSDASVYIP